MAKKHTAGASVTITDLSDGKALNSYMSMSLGTSQIYDRDKKTYQPNYSSTNQVITINSFVSGSLTDVATQLIDQAWKINGVAPSGSNYTVAPGKLTIKANMTNPTNTIEFTGNYVDPVSTLKTPVRLSGTIVKQDATGNAITAQMKTPKGTIFKIVPGEARQQLELTAELYRGGVLDDTDITRTWYKDGVKLSHTGKTLTVTPDDITNVATYSCEIKDTDASSSTHGGTSVCYATIHDATDPIWIELELPKGTNFPNGVGTLVLIPIVRQQETVIERGDVLATGAKFTYVWKKMKDGELVAAWSKTPVGGTAGKIEITGAADGAGRYIVEATEK